MNVIEETKPITPEEIERIVFDSLKEIPWRESGFDMGVTFSAEITFGASVNVSYDAFPTMEHDERFRDNICRMLARRIMSNIYENRTKEFIEAVKELYKIGPYSFSEQREVIHRMIKMAGALQPQEAEA